MVFRPVEREPVQRVSLAGAQKKKQGEEIAGMMGDSVPNKSFSHFRIA